MDILNVNGKTIKDTEKSKEVATEENTIYKRSQVKIKGYVI